MHPYDLARMPSDSRKRMQERRKTQQNKYLPMNNEHEYLKRMQTEHGAVIEWATWSLEWKYLEEGVPLANSLYYRICPIWLEERLKETQPEEEYEFKIGQRYWFISVRGQILEAFWCAHPFDFDRYAMGNCYYSKEEAQVARDRQLARVKAERERTSEPEDIWVNKDKEDGQLFLHDSEEKAKRAVEGIHFAFEYIAKCFVEADHGQ